MFTEYFNRQLSKANSLKDRTVFLLLSLLAFFIRLPFFFRDYIDRDESTFILMGESWVNGHLPYTEIWDLKPPLVYLLFAGIISIFGKSFVAIRMLGVLAVGITAYFTYAMGKQLHSRQTGLLAAMGCVYLISLFGSLQGVMSEHLSMPFFMSGLYLLLKQRSSWYLLLSGLLMGAAIMIKLNLGYAVALPVLFMISQGIRNKEPLKGFGQAAVFGFGLLLVVFLCWLPYILEGQSRLWWNSVVLAPLEYTEARRYSVLKLAPIVVFTALFFYFSFRKKWLPSGDRAVSLLSLAVVGVVLSFIQGGRVNGHYLIQFHPVFLVLLGLVLSRALPPLAAKWKPWTLLLLILLPFESYREYYEIGRYKMERGTFFNGEGFSVPAYLIENQMETADVFFLEYHIGYWLLPANPPTKAATHPSNLCRDELFRFYDNPRETSMQELTYIMDTLQPEIVITRYERRIFDRKEEEENRYMVNYLKTHYEIVALVDGAEIHRRLK
jgi:hypothetical protein